MKICVFISDDGPDSRQMQELGKNLEIEGNEVAEYLWESDDATSLATLYDIHDTPAILVTANDGRYIEMWQGEIPAMSDVMYRTRNA